METLQQRTPIPADLPEATHLSVLLGQSDIDRLLVHIHANKNLASKSHTVVADPRSEKRGYSLRAVSAQRSGVLWCLEPDS